VKVGLEHRLDILSVKICDTGLRCNLIDGATEIADGAAGFESISERIPYLLGDVSVRNAGYCEGFAPEVRTELKISRTADRSEPSHIFSLWACA
jgi:hypothetical protein